MTDLIAALMEYELLVAWLGREKAAIAHRIIKDMGAGATDDQD